MGRIITISTYKGGSGKTLVASNLAEALNANKKSVCLIDLDGQANIEMTYGYSYDYFSNKSVLSVLNESKKLNEAIVSLNDSGLDLLPSEMNLAYYDHLLNKDKKLNDKLSQLLNYLKQEYDFVIIDTPPQISSVLYVCWKNSDLIISPFTLELQNLQGVIHVINLANQYESNAKIMLLPNKVKANSSVQEAIYKHTLEFVASLNNPNVIFSKINIPSSTLFVKHQLQFHKPLSSYNSNAKLYQKPITAFKDLAKYIIKITKK